jgi:hypothetical protein
VNTTSLQGYIYIYIHQIIFRNMIPRRRAVGPSLCSAGFSDFSGVFAESERGVTVEVGEELSITVDGAVGGWGMGKLEDLNWTYRRWDNGSAHT